MSFEQAEATLLKESFTKSSFVKYRANVLQQLCTKYEIPVQGTGRCARRRVIKSDYIAALMGYVSPASLLECNILTKH